MKSLSLTSSMLVLALASGCGRSSGTTRSSSGTRLTPPTFSSFDAPGGTNVVQAHMIKFVNADIEQAFALYQELSERSLIRSPMVPANVKISFENAAPLTRAEALQGLDNVFAANNIVMVYLGTRYVKAVPAAQAPTEPGPVLEMPWPQLPDSSSYITYIAKLKHLSAEQAASSLQPFAKLPNSIIGARGSDVIILRDYSSNVRRMMEILEAVDKPGTNSWPFPFPARK
jgi:general secretion pathway protein D